MSDFPATPAGVRMLADFSKAPVLLPFSESKHLKAPAELIKGILPLGGLGMLWGAPGSYKSFVALDWAFTIASELGSWLGKKAKSGKVWYLAGEGHEGLDKRVRAWRKAHQYTGKLDLMVSPRALVLDAPEGVSDDLVELVRLIDEGQAPALIVIDTLSRSMSGDENSSQDSARYIAAIDFLFAAIRKSSAKVTVLIVHHSRKDNDIYRGSTVFRGAIDFEFEMVKSSPLRATLEHRKSKDGEMIDALDFEFAVENVGTVEDDFGEVVEITSLSVWIEKKVNKAGDGGQLQSESASLAYSVKQVLDRHPNGVTKRALLEELRSMGGMPRNQRLIALLDVLEAQGVIQMSAGARRSQLVMPGRVFPEFGKQSLGNAENFSVDGKDPF